MLPPSCSVRTGSRALRDGGGAAVVDAVRDLAADVICIASVIGTVLKQHEPAVNYVNQFGPFWAELFLALKLNAVYSAWWFLLILAFLVVSTSLCIARNTPKILADLRSYKENIREQSLKAFTTRPGRTLARARGRGPAHRPDCWPAAAGRCAAAARPGGTAGWWPPSRCGQQDRLHRRAQRHRADLPGRPARRRPDRARADGSTARRLHGGGLIADVKPEHRLPDATPPSAATCWCRGHAASARPS
jgi:cytochrome c biogenesis protein